jgi:plasmid maintenance system antidote protein VapI
MQLPKISKAELFKILDEKNKKTLHPGEVLDKIFNFLDINYKDVALKMQVWSCYLQEIMITTRSISDEDDRNLARILGIPRGLLMDMQAEYDEFKHKEHKLWLTKYQQNTL